MQRIFSPAIVLLNRMGYTSKFSLLWLMSLVAMSVVMYSLFASLDRVIQPSQRQLQGLALIEPITRTVQHIQLHRGISTVLLGGNESMKDRRTNSESEATEAFKTMEGVLPSDMVSNKDFQLIKADWDLLRKEGLHWTLTENFAAHTRLIEQLLSFEMLVADEYLLTLDTELASNYLVDTAIIELPHVLEHLGHLRAYGTGILSRKQITEHEKMELQVMMGELDSTLKSLNLHLGKAARYNPTLQKSLLTMRDGIADSARQITDFVTLDMLYGHFAQHPATFLDIATVAIDDSYAQIYQSLLPTVKTLIEARIARAENTLFMSIGGSLLLFLLVVYFSVSMYYAIIGSIKSLVSSAHTFASGDLKQRVKLNTRDELSQIGDSFNKMADGFNALLEARKLAEDAIQKSKDLLQSVVENVPVRIFWKDRNSRYLGCNTWFAKDSGHARPDELTDKTDFDMGWQDRAELYRADDKAVMESGTPKLNFEEPQTTPGGSTIWLRTSKVPLRDRINQVIGILGIYEDITDRKQAELTLIESQARLSAVIDTALDAVVQMDAAGIIIGWTHQAEKIFGWTSGEAIGRMLHETIIPPQYREAHVQGLAHFLASGEAKMLNSRIESLGLHRDGHEFPVELSVTPINAADKYEFSAFIRDITRKKESDDLIWKQANFDTLTGLPNRHMFYDRLAQDIKKAHRAGLKTALLFIDLDKFKEVNDTLGHSMGDILLKEAAHRIGGCVRETDTVARLGGDEFTVILAELDDTGSVERIAENILQSLAKPYRLGDETAYISASIGITVHPVDAVAVEDLIKNADQAMYAAKDGGRNCFNYFTQSMQQAVQARMQLSRELHGALESDQFMVYYQPIVDIATGCINKAEALIRWQHPELGWIGPAKFIPLAEETGLIVEIGDWVFNKSALQAKRWRSLYNTDFQISVNVSPLQLRSADSQYKIWFDYLQELGLPGQSLVIEITEGLLLDAGSSITSKLLEFRDAGIQVAIDDFGTGYSSLSYLKKFDIDYLKIDQSFVRDMETDQDDMALSEAIIVMAHKLGLKVIAEGVETEAQRKLLTAAGCDYAQGYLFSRPVSAEEFEELLKGQEPESQHFQI